MINVLFSGNSGVFDGVLTCILSIFKRSSPDTYNFYIMTMDLTRKDEKYTPIDDKHIEFLQKVVNKYSPESKVIKIDVTNIYEEDFGYSPNENCYCSPFTLLRLFADKCNLPDKILYLDVDVLFNRDIHLLYDIDVTGYEYCASRDHYGKFLINPNYINAGVILFNMPECIKNGLFEKARELIKTKKLVFADQSAIIRSTTKRKVLSQRFNDQKFLRKNTVIRHFSKRLFWLPYPHTDNIKQWHVSKMLKTFKYFNFDDILFEYIYLKRSFEENN